MSKKIDIMTIGKLLISLLAVVFLLSACTDDPQARENNLYNTGEGDTETAQSRAAEVAEQNKPEGVDCWQGQVLNLIYDVIGKTIMVQYNNLSAGAMNLMMMGFAVWLALRILKFVSSVAEVNASEVWNEIIRKAFICFVCGYLAGSANMLLYVINYILFPIYGAFLEFGNEILAMTQDTAKSVTVFDERIDFTVTEACVMSGDAKASLDGGFPAAFQDNMRCMICQVTDKLRLGRKMSYIAMSMPGVLPVLTGLLLMAMFQVVIWGFVFYLVDSIFRFGMIILMLPIFIMAYAFGPTKKWTGIGFVNIMHSAAFMMAFSIMISSILLAITSLITDEETGKIFNPSNSVEHFNQISLVTLCLILIGFLVWKSLDVAQELTGAIIGGGIDSKFQQNLKAVGQMVKNIVVGGIGWGLNKIGFYDGTALGRALSAGGRLQERLNELAGRKN